jgi:hypothetical protein
MSHSIYKPWLRNLYVRRLYILFGMPFALLAMVAHLTVKSMREAIAESIKAWQPEDLSRPS